MLVCFWGLWPLRQEGASKLQQQKQLFPAYHHAFEMLAVTVIYEHELA